MLDIDKNLKLTVKKGKVKIGAKESKTAIDNGSAKLIVISNNCINSDEIKKLSDKNKIPIYNYNKHSIDLGYICGKAFAVSVFAIIDDGGSNIQNLVKKGN